MKVLHVITRMNTGGPAVFLDHLTNAMNDLSTQSTIAYGFCESNETDFTQTHKLSAQLLEIKTLHRSLSPIDDLRSFRRLRRIIKDLEPDLINTHTSKAGVLGRLAAKSVNKNLPVVHTFHGHLIYGYFARYKSWVFTVIEKIMGKYTDAAVAVTSETKRSLTNLGIGKKLLWRVIQLGIPVKSIASNLGQNGVFNLLWVGRFTDIKDPKYAIEVVKHLSKASPNNFSLTMVGEGELFSDIKLEAKNLPITFTGWLTAPFENIPNFDLLLITSKNEGLPLVMLEAANYGRPTISNNVGGISEFISDNQTGYLTEIDPIKMANRIIEIASDRKSFHQIGLNANKLLGEKFSVTKMAENYKDLYMQLVIRK
jgi:glycosyltransferase involved in cell wall biosynthesis